MQTSVPRQLADSVQPIVLVLAGGIGAGKSSLAGSISQAIGWPHVSFGDFVRREAVLRGRDGARNSLQETGVELIAEGWEAFVRGVLAMAVVPKGKGLIVEGVRHHCALTELANAVAPQQLWSVYLDTQRDTRLARAESRGENRRELEQADSHPVESEIATLGVACDVILPASLPIRELTDTVLSLLTERWGTRPKEAT